MSSLLIGLSTGLHALATVILVGHYLLLGMVYLPVFEQQLSGAALGGMLERLSGRLRPFMGGSLLIFIITGTHLMLIDQNYLGFGDFGNLWGVLIVVKHVLVLVMAALAIYAERVLVGRLSSGTGPAALGQLRLALSALIVLGLLILFMTAYAQTM
jgi:uncharacterized membrane protein